jgi:hypothetical protein
MSLSFLLVGVLFLLVLGGAALMFWLIANHRTRKLGLILMCVGGLMGVLFAVPLLGLGLFEVMRYDFQVKANDSRAHVEMMRSRRPTIEAEKGHRAEKADVPSAPPANTRPAWVGAQPGLVGDGYRMSVTVGPYTTRQECDAHLGEELQKALDHYVEICLGRRSDERITLPAELLRRQLVKEQWEEVGQYSVGPMTQLHVLLEFDRKMRDRVLAEHQRAIVAGRLWYAGAGLAVVLAGLTGAYGYLKMTGRRKMTNDEARMTKE